jgi:hypothetical protein
MGIDRGMQNTINIITPTKKGMIRGLSDTIEESNAMYSKKGKRTT